MEIDRIQFLVGPKAPGWKDIIALAGKDATSGYQCAIDIPAQAAIRQVKALDPRWRKAKIYVDYNLAENTGSIRVTIETEPGVFVRKVRALRPGLEKAVPNHYDRRSFGDCPSGMIVLDLNDPDWEDTHSSAGASQPRKAETVKENTPRKRATNRAWSRRQRTIKKLSTRLA